MADGFAMLRDAGRWLVNNQPPSYIQIRTSAVIPRDVAIPTRRGLPVRKGEPFDGLLLHPNTWAEVDVRISFDSWMERAEREARRG